MCSGHLYMTLMPWPFQALHLGCCGMAAGVLLGCFGALPNLRPNISLSTYISIWRFPKMWKPQNGWFIMEIIIKMDDLGVPPFQETSIDLYSIFQKLLCYYLDILWLPKICNIPHITTWPCFLVLRVTAEYIVHFFFFDGCFSFLTGVVACNNNSLGLQHNTSPMFRMCAFP